MNDISGRIYELKKELIIVTKELERIELSFKSAPCNKGADFFLKKSMELQNKKRGIESAIINLQDKK